MFAWRKFLGTFGQILNFASMIFPVLKPFAVAFNIVMGLANGGLKGGLLAVFGSQIPGFDHLATNIAVGALYGGFSAVVMGGKFKEGVVGSLKSAAIGMVMGAIAQGVKSRQTGGKFGNGATSDAQDAAISDGSGRGTPGDPQKAKQAMQRADAALRKAGAYKGYKNEAAAAKAWRKHVLPIADDLGVEIAALISKVDGEYHLGSAFSIGSPDSATGLFTNGTYVAGGKITAYVHTHPAAGGWVGRNRAFEYNQFPESDGRGNLLGGHNMTQFGADLSGDLVSAYAVGLNAYIADSAGLHGWNYSTYRQMQVDVGMGLVQLGTAMRDY